MKQLFRTIWPLLLLLATGASAEESATMGVNRIESYRVRWWGAPGSEWKRPIYEMLRIENGPLEIRHAVLPGRELGDYRLPYWPIRSFLSVIRRPAELPHRGYVEYSSNGKLKTSPLVVQGGFELAAMDNADVLKVTNQNSDCPLLMEHFFVIAKNDPTIQVLVQVTNTSRQVTKKAVPCAVYAQDFNWNDFGVSHGKKYVRVQAPTKGTASGFFAFSPGMRRGYEFVAGENCTLSYRLTSPLNLWEVTMTGPTTDLAAGESLSFHYFVRATDNMPNREILGTLLSTQNLLKLPFRKIEATTFKTAPIISHGRVMLPQLIDQLQRPKVRGLNLRASPTQALRDLKTLKDWGCNLVIIGAKDNDRTARLIKAGHRLGMEMFVSGSGSFGQGPPRFDRLYSKPLPPA